MTTPEQLRLIQRNSAARGAYMNALRAGGGRGGASPGATGGLAGALVQHFVGLPAALNSLSAQAGTSVARRENRPTVRPTPNVGILTGMGPIPHHQIDVQGGITGAVGGIQGGGGWQGAILGGLAGLLGSGSEPAQGSPVIPGGSGLAAGGPCPDGTFSILGRCVDLIPGGATSGAGMIQSRGEAVHGQYGVGVVPAVRSQQVRDCPAGMVLGLDGVCYNRSQLRKDERAHRPPRKPLLTGGDLNAISRAARVSRALERKTKELQRLGMLKKPTTRRK